MLRKLLIVDGNSLIHRGFHAIPHLSTKSGEPTNGVYGFALLFLKAIKELKPDYVVATFDYPAPSFREKIYEPYKAHRVKAPDELYAQIPRVKELVQAFNLPVYELQGYEADDLIGTLAVLAQKTSDLEAIILTGDMDALQLVNGKVKVYTPKQGLSETRLYDSEAVKARYGIEPSQMVDYKALRGDPSDNIPGVKGIGEKTAVELLQKFGNIENIYDYLNGKDASKIKPRIAKLLVEHKTDVDVSKKLGEIVKDVKIQLDLNKAKMNTYDEASVFKLFQDLEFRSLLEKLPKRTNHELRITNQAVQKKDKSEYILIDDEKKYTNLLTNLAKQKEFALDTETTSINPLEAKLLGVGIGWKAQEAYYIPAGLLGSDFGKILADQTIKKIGHNIKYDLLVLKKAGFSVKGIYFDTMIAAYLRSPGSRSFDLDSLTFNEFGFRKTLIASLIGEGRKQISMSEVEVQKVSDYCCEDVDYTWRLKNKLIEELRRLKLDKVFFDIEIPLIPILADMETLGIKIDSKVLRRLSLQAEAEIEKLESKIHRLSGEEFNIGSPIQLKRILFEKLDIPSHDLKKGKTGLSTAANELEKLRGLHPVVELLFDWRELTKLKNTYLDALPKLINPKTGRVHTSFNQTIAATGRLSSSDPNLQNIPIRTEFGRKIRSAFVTEKGFKLTSIDYSQIELRLAAHLSQDPKMIEAFESNEDIHTATAREIFVLKSDIEVTPDMRRNAKTINFGVLYGLSAHGLKTRIPGISQGEAQDFIDKYFDTYKNLTAYLEEVIRETRRKGYVKNEIGRMRFLPEINSSQYQVRSAAERAAINMPLQSLAADIIKMAMNKLAEQDLLAKQDCRLVLQVHDELVFEIAEKKLVEYIPKITKTMSEVYKLKVPLVVEAKVGDNWEEMSIYK